MTTEFELFDKRFNLFTSSKDFITLTPPIITDKILQEIKQFISEHFLPKSKVREKIEKMKIEKSEKCSHCGGSGDTMKCQGGSDWAYKDAYNQALQDLLKDLDL